MISNEQLDVIVEGTKYDLINQRNVPMSPGSICKNGTAMCLGAMLVHEALRGLSSSEEACEYARRVVHEDGSFIEDTGEQIGLNRDMVLLTKRINDSLEAENRLQGVLEHLQSLRQVELVQHPH